MVAVVAVGTRDLFDTRLGRHTAMSVSRRGLLTPRWSGEPRERLICQFAQVAAAWWPAGVDRAAYHRCQVARDRAGGGQAGHGDRRLLAQFLSLSRRLTAEQEILGTLAKDRRGFRLHPALRDLIDEPDRSSVAVVPAIVHAPLGFPVPARRKPGSGLT